MKNLAKMSVLLIQSFLEGGLQISVLVAVAASQTGERVLRGSRGYLQYRKVALF